MKIMIIIVVIFSLIFVTPYNKTTLNIYKNLNKINNKVDNISFGGCGLFALKLSNYLDTLNISHQIITFNLTNNPIPNHVMIQTKFGTIDNNGIFQNFTINLIPHKIITKKQLIHLTQQKGWNNKFNQKDTTYFQFK